MNDIILARLAALRAEMAKAGIDAFVIPQTDPHQSEYIAAHWQIRRYISGFTGSAGSLVVTADKALLWTDSRYFLQAGQQLDGTGIVLMKEGVEGTPEIPDWLVANLKQGQTVGVNGMLFSIDNTKALSVKLAANGLKLDTKFDPIDLVWPDRPDVPATPAYIHDIKYAGAAPAEKIKVVLENAKKQGANAVFISALDEIAWILNLRSDDITNSPVAMAFLYLGYEDSTLFINQAKVTAEVLQHLIAAQVANDGYNDVERFLTHLPLDARVLVSSTQNAGRILEWLGDRAVVGTSPVAVPKAIKNPTQIEGVRQAMKRDGVAMVRSLMEIQKRIADGVKTTEMDVADILLKNRKAQAMFKDISFATIAGWAGHGAIVHYSATPDSNATIGTDNLLLIDSGANYLDGTTDITRTIAIGTPTADMIHDFTLVMKGHIAIATAEWPDGTRGHQLDAMARMPLWKEGKSYLHGTGHGVGHFLNVHEGPQSIRLNDTGIPLLPGMITSNEPGVYLSDRYGIRCENLVLTVHDQETEFGKFYRFDTLTLCPFDRKLFDIEMMSEDEIDWVDEYHANVREQLTPLLQPEEQKWLAEATKSLLVVE